MGKKITAEDFIEKAKKIHGDRYDYSLVEYKGSTQPVTIICPKHGEFKQRACTHLEGKGCKECGLLSRRKTTDEFIKEAKMVHGNKYDYSETNYISAKKPVKIICPKHGYFVQKASSHLDGCGCLECGKELISRKNKTKKDVLLKKFRKVHGNKYSYDLSTFVNCKKKIKMFCPIHGEFWQCPSSHLKGNGCQKCAREEVANKKFKGTETFIEEANKIHDGKYDYSKSQYNGCSKPITIICPMHGEFKQIASEHIRGHGCPRCNESKLENEVKMILKEENISFSQQKKFDWLGKLSLDFYLPKYNIAIECQGEQHFVEVRFGGKNQKDTLEKLNKNIERDIRKFKLCKENGIRILYYTHFKQDDNLINNKKELIKRIING